MTSLFGEKENSRRRQFTLVEYSSEKEKESSGRGRHVLIITLLLYGYS
jgi:hypothetical protein